MPTNYDIIRDAILQKKAISFTYDKDPSGSGVRTLLPYVLGRSEDSDTGVEEKTVLCYQYDGYTPGTLQTPHPHVANWRCFKVDSVDSVTVFNFGEAWQPFKMTGKHRTRQNCVEIRDVWRPPS